MFKTYILKSIKNGRYYIGHTSNIEERVLRHNSGRSKFTKSGMPWKLVYTENYPTKAEAFRRETEIKSYKGGFKFKNLFNMEGWQNG